MKEKNDIQELFRKYTEGHISQQELNILYRYFKSEKNPQQLKALIEAHYRHQVHSNTPLKTQATNLVNRAWLNIYQHTAPKTKTYTLPKWWYAVAACLLIFGATLGYLQFRQKPSLYSSKYGGDVLPAKGKATLLLENGTAIALQQNKNGIVTQNGHIAYADGADIKQAQSVQYAKLVTPNGGRYQVTLPDGTKVQLNAASTLRYPTRFKGNTREVQLTGEAYFEVKRNTRKPFIVQSGLQKVVVTGTAFNISAYADQADIKTTLVNGSVKIQLPATQQKLKPGQQARLQNGNIEVKAVDTETYTAWRSNQFVFKGESLRNILLQLQHWYNLEINFNQLPEKSFYGRISRDVPLSQVLNMLEQSGHLQIKIEGRKLMVK